MEFGNSGSPVTLRAPWELSGKQKISRFHWAGTLSLSKGTWCPNKHGNSLTILISSLLNILINYYLKLANWLYKLADIFEYSVPGGVNKFNSVPCQHRVLKLFIYKRLKMYIGLLYEFN